MSPKRAPDKCRIPRWWAESRRLGANTSPDLLRAAYASGIEDDAAMANASFEAPGTVLQGVSHSLLQRHRQHGRCPRARRDGAGPDGRLNGPALTPTAPRVRLRAPTSGERATDRPPAIMRCTRAESLALEKGRRYGEVRKLLFLDAMLLEKLGRAFVALRLQRTADVHIGGDPRASTRPSNAARTVWSQAQPSRLRPGT